MATRYNVYASGVDYDADSSGDWVSADDHEAEVEALDTKVSELEDELADAKRELANMEAERDTALSDLELLKQHANDLESVVHGLATKLANIVEPFTDRDKYPTLDELKKTNAHYVPYGAWRGE